MSSILLSLLFLNLLVHHSERKWFGHPTHSLPFLSLPSSFSGVLFAPLLPSPPVLDPLLPSLATLVISTTTGPDQCDGHAFLFFFSCVRVSLPLFHFDILTFSDSRHLFPPPFSFSLFHPCVLSQATFVVLLFRSFAVSFVLPSYPIFRCSAFACSCRLDWPQVASGRLTLYPSPPHTKKHKHDYYRRKRQKVQSQVQPCDSSFLLSVFAVSAAVARFLARPPVLSFLASLHQPYNLFYLFWLLLLFSSPSVVSTTCNIERCPWFASYSSD